MHIRILNQTREFYRRIITSIGFWPTAISFLFATLATLLLYLDTNDLTTLLVKHAPGLVIKDGDTARTLLATSVGGMLSLTVFSFTMVMSQLNRAATNYSPRLLPGLISTRRHQIVLGIFLGTITYCLFILINIEPSDDEYALPGLAVLVGVVLTLLSLSVFIYFIHSISRAIQVSLILRQVEHKTARRLELLIDDEARQGKSASTPTNCDVALRSHRTGYLCTSDVGSLKKIAAENELQIVVTALQGDFILENTVPVKVSKEVDEETADAILSCLILDGDELIERNYILGFTQITEVAVRAMSPGVNDPGTALSAIDHLTHLLSLRMKFDDKQVYEDENGEPSVAISVISFADLLYILMAPLRLYCRHDVVIVLRLLQMLDHLLQQRSILEAHNEAIKTELLTLKEDALSAISTERDKEKVRERADQIKTLAA